MAYTTRSTTNGNIDRKEMKTLALGFHKGALDSLKETIDILDTWLLPINHDEFHYNMTHERAKMLWDKYKDKFNEYDCVITTDTTPLSRIFLQGDYQGRLIIWICNRFDYADGNFQFDRLLVGGRVELDGNLQIDVNRPPSRALGFKILTGELSGMFDNISPGSRIETTDGRGSFLFTCDTGDLNACYSLRPLGR